MNGFKEILTHPLNISLVRPKKFLTAGCILLSLLLVSCMAQDAQPAKKQSVTVYTDHLGENDSLLFEKFKKEEKITVYYKVLPADSILAIIQGEKYNSHADLILLHGADQLQQAGKMKLFSTITSEKLLAETDKNYISPQKNWIALSKSPIVLIYDQRILKPDTISFYNEVLQPKWKGKIALQDPSSSTLNVLGNSISQLNVKHKRYLSQLNAQTSLPRSGNDLTQIKRINLGQAQLAFVELSSLVESNERRDTLDRRLYKNIKVIFPGQTQKGSFYNVTGAGIYKYARNAGNAEKLLQFLGSKRAQYAFASGRAEFPVLEVKTDFRLEEYGKFRARFIANRSRKKM
jgi:iron(III) transport system substrate-binding protein